MLGYQGVTPGYPAATPSHPGISYPGIPNAKSYYLKWLALTALGACPNCFLITYYILHMTTQESHRATLRLRQATRELYRATTEIRRATHPKVSLLLYMCFVFSNNFKM